MACACHKNAIGTIGDLVLVWPSDVDDFVRHLDVDMQATDRAARTCVGLPAGTLASWTQFLGSWTKFRDEGTGIFGSGGRMDNARIYQRDLSNWQALITSAKCDLAAPRVQEESDATSSAIKWIAAAAIVGGVVYLAGPAIRSTLSRIAR